VLCARNRQQAKLAKIAAGLVYPLATTDFGRRAFSSAALQIWNHIPDAIKVSPSLDSFKRHLNTHYFTSPCNFLTT